MEREPGGGPGWPASIRAGTTYGATIAAHALSLGGRAPFQLAFDGPDATPPLLPGFLGVAVGFLERRGGFTPRREMPPLVRHPRQGLGHGGTDGGWAVRDAPDSGSLECLLHRASERRQVVWGGRQPTPSQESLTGETSAQAPEDCMADVGLEAIERQDDATAGLREALAAERLWQREGHQCVVTLQEIGDRPWGHGHAALDQSLRDCRDTPVGAGAPLSKEGHNSKAKCLLGEC
jgi:hypothetical protein